MLVTRGLGRDGSAGGPLVTGGLGRYTVVIDDGAMRATLSGTSALHASASAIASIETTLEGYGSILAYLTDSGTTVGELRAELAGASTLSAQATALARLEGALSGGSSLVSTAEATARLNAVLAGHGSITAYLAGAPVVPGTYVQFGGMWYLVQDVYVNSGGSWIQAPELYSKKNGNWVQVWG
jgi:hypothetical protein